MARARNRESHIKRWVLLLVLALRSCDTRYYRAESCVDEHIAEEPWMDGGLPSFLYDRFNFVDSRGPDVSLNSNNKKNILWLSGSPDDNADIVNRYLRDPASRRQFAKIVFGSESQRSQYNDYFRGPFEQGVVLKPSIFPLPVRSKDQDGPIRLMHLLDHDREAGIISSVFRELYESSGDTISLDVYSTCASDTDLHSDSIETCRHQPGCNYHGALTRDETRKAFLKAHVFLVPPKWQASVPVKVLEALGAGCEVMAPNIGSLPELLSGFGVMYPHNEGQSTMTRSLGMVIASYWGEASVKKRRMQQLYAAQLFNWGFFGHRGRVEEWVFMLADLDEELSGDLPSRTAFESGSKYVEALVVIGRMHEKKGDKQRALQLYDLAHTLDPQNSHALISLGLLGLEIGTSVDNPHVQDMAVAHLEFALSSATVRPVILPDTAVYYEVSLRLGLHLIQLYKDKPSYKWFDNGLRSLYPHDDCWAVFRALNVPHLPLSPEEEVRNIENYHSRINDLLKKDFFMCSTADNVGSVFPVAYYDLDFKEELQAYVSLLMKAFPWLTYQSPGLVYDDSPSISLSSQTRPIKIGVISSFMEPHSSIWGSFGMTIRFLQSHPQLDVSLIYYPKDPIQERDKLLSLRPETNIYLDKLGSHGYDVLSKNRRLIEEREFDVLLYLDLWMTMELHQIAISKLAPIQICTHGHPVTSAVPRKIMDYYLSWEAAELPDKSKAQSFYTEELIMLPPTVWEYYEPRSTPAENSIAGGSFGHYTRQNLDFVSTERDRALLLHPNATWYFCAQATFKYHITFDRILGEIQKQDPNAVLILIQFTGNLSELFVRTKERLANLGHVDLDRIVFIPRMNHPNLMAMYKLSDVVLDSVFFGGDTTTREAFETGAPVITLPHKTIGQRWTQAYYRTMGIPDFIAENPGDFVRIAVEVANRPKPDKLRLREQIKTAANEKLFRSHDGYPEWAKALIDVAGRPRRWHWKNQPRGQVHGATHEER